MPTRLGYIQDLVGNKVALYDYTRVQLGHNRNIFILVLMDVLCVLEEQ